jgi:hypothetical protein
MVPPSFSFSPARGRWALPSAPSSSILTFALDPTTVAALLLTPGCGYEKKEVEKNGVAD